MVDVNAQLQRKVGLTTVPWELAEDAVSPTDVADPVIEQGLRTRLDQLRTVLNDILAAVDGEPANVVTLDAPTLAALETITVANMVPAVETGLAKELTLTALRNRADLLATQTTLQQVADKLVDIYAAVDGLEVTAGNIEISSETINLQTDEVEALLQTVRDRLPALLDVDGGLRTHVQNLPDVFDVSDRAVRQVGVVTGPSLAQQATLARKFDTVVPFSAKFSGDDPAVVDPGTDALRVHQMFIQANPAISGAVEFELRVGTTVLDAGWLEAAQPSIFAALYEGAPGETLGLVLVPGGKEVRLNVRYKVI